MAHLLQLFPLLSPQKILDISRTAPSSPKVPLTKLAIASGLLPPQTNKPPQPPDSLPPTPSQHHQSPQETPTVDEALSRYQKVLHQKTSDSPLKTKNKGVLLNKKRS